MILFPDEVSREVNLEDGHSYGSAQPQTRATSTVCHSQFCPLPACRDRRQILRDGKLIRAGLFSLRMNPEFGFMTLIAMKG